MRQAHFLRMTLPQKVNKYIKLADSTPLVMEPMLPTLVKLPFSNPDWLFEPKWDGYRAICFVENGHVRFISRHQKSLTEKFPSLRGIANSIKAKVAVLDGEIVALDNLGAPRFEGLRAKSPDYLIVYLAFDLLTVDRRNLTQLPLVERKAALKRILPKRQTGKIRFTNHVVGDGLHLFKDLERMKLEGMVAKRLDSVYVSGRSRAWLKVKTRAGKKEMEDQSGVRKRIS
jgi:bifunctional non-homologous end joining protein LigD